MASLVQRVVAALLAVSLAGTPAVLGACAAQCAPAMAHAGGSHSEPAGPGHSAAAQPEGRGGAARPAAARAAGHDSHPAERHHHATPAPSSVAAHHDSGIAPIPDCCADEASMAAIPARLVDRQATTLLDTAIDAAAPLVAPTPARQPGRSASLAAPHPPHRRPLVLRI